MNAPNRKRGRRLKRKPCLITEARSFPGSSLPLMTATRRTRRKHTHKKSTNALLKHVNVQPASMDFSCVNNSCLKIKCASDEKNEKLGAFFFKNLFPVPSCSVVISMWVNILIIARHLIPPLLRLPVINMWASLLLIWVFLRESMHVPVYPPLMSPGHSPSIEMKI